MRVVPVPTGGSGSCEGFVTPVETGFEVALTHLDSLKWMALRLCRDWAEAEDLVQETYLSAFRHFDQFRPGTNCRAWLCTILRNTFLNRRRRESRQLLRVDGEDLAQCRGLPEFVAHVANPEDEYLARVEGRELLEALGRLPGRFRDVILLADVEECSYKEIAQVSGVPVGTVMSRLFRARRLLRRRIGDRFGAQAGVGVPPAGSPLPTARRLGQARGLSQVAQSRVSNGSGGGRTRPTRSGVRAP